jgi:hypothetical protein
MRDTVLVIATIVGLVWWLGFVIGAIMRARGDRRWDHALLGGALPIPASYAVLLVDSWVAGPR